MLKALSFPPVKSALLLALIVVTPFVALSAGPAWLRILDFALLYVLLAVGLNLVVGFAGLLDLGYIAFYAVGAYTWAFLASPHFGVHWPFWIVLPLGAAFAALAGVILGAPVLRLRGDYLAIVTLGFGEIVRIFMNNLNYPINITNGPQGINMLDPLKLFGLDISRKWVLSDSWSVHPLLMHYFVFVAAVAISVFILRRLQCSRIGRAWAAMRDDHLAAQAVGIPLRNMKLLAFAFGATFGGVAGGLFGAFQGFVSPESFSLMESITVLAMVVFGGMGNLTGVIVGALVLAWLPEALRSYAIPLQQALFGKTLLDPEILRMLVYALALIFMMLLRPVGLIPARVRYALACGKAATSAAAQATLGVLAPLAKVEQPLLVADQVAKRFGGVQAVGGVSLRIQAGEVYGLIGPNGAGKTSFFNLLSGAYTPDSGVFLLAGQALPAGNAAAIVQRGVARTFQNIRLFRELTALENVMVGRHTRSRAGIWGIIWQTAAVRAEEAAMRDKALALLAYVGIENFADHLAASLSYGDQRRLEIARALATEPCLLALDEPAAGMNATETEQLRALIERMHHDGITVLLIEHDVKLVMGLCDRVAVLDFGKKIAEDVPAMVQRDPAVIDAYLGGSQEDLATPSAAGVGV